MPTLESTDIQQAHHHFQRARNRVVEVTTGLSDAQWHFKPAPDRWSIAENLEHMVTVQERILGPVREQLAQAPAPDPGRDWVQIDRIIFEKLPDRSMKANAPEPIQPTGKSSPLVSIERLHRNYQRLAEFVESTPGLRNHILESPPLRFITGGAHTTMDGYQFAITVASHDLRHVGQILEIQAHPNYPA